MVADLARAGSRNYQLLLRLQARGAVVMGTESPELLLEEYRLVSADLASGAMRATERQRAAYAAVLEKRDRFMAQRINSTLAIGETGILFVGLLHAVERYLESDMEVIHPIRPPEAGTDGPHQQQSPDCG